MEGAGLNGDVWERVWEREVRADARPWPSPRVVNLAGTPRGSRPCPVRGQPPAAAPPGLQQRLRWDRAGVPTPFGLRQALLGV